MAKSVINDLLNSIPSAYVHCEFLAIINFFVSVWVPRWLLDYAFSQTSELGKLKIRLQEEEK